MNMVTKAHAQRSERVQVALHEGVTRFIGDVDEKESEKDAGKDKTDISARSAGQLSPGANVVVSSSKDGKVERFFHALVLALFSADRQTSSSHGIHTSDTEGLRLARLRMVSKLCQSRAVDSRTRETLTTVLKYWLETERSQPIRELLVESVRTNSSLADESA